MCSSDLAGYWTAPGGKLLPGEDPEMGVRREIREETGLELGRVDLRLVVSETAAHPAYNWLLFIFRSVFADAEGPPGEDPPPLPQAPAGLRAGGILTREGRLDWVPRDRLAQLQLHEVDRCLLPYVLAPEGAPRYYVRIRYGDAGQVEALHVQILPAGREAGEPPRKPGRGRGLGRTGRRVSDSPSSR